MTPTFREEASQFTGWIMEHDPQYDEIMDKHEEALQAAYTKGKEEERAEWQQAYSGLSPHEAVKIVEEE